MALATENVTQVTADDAVIMAMTSMLKGGNYQPDFVRGLQQMFGTLDPSVRKFHRAREFGEELDRRLRQTSGRGL